MFSQVTIRGKGGSVPRPDSLRQRVRSACKGILLRGEYPTTGKLREALPDVPVGTLQTYRYSLMRELGMFPDVPERPLDLARLATA